MLDVNLSRWFNSNLLTSFQRLWSFFDTVYCVGLSLLQQLESLVWERSGNSFVSSHSDGGYMVWAVSSSNPCTHDPISSTIPYGEPQHMPITQPFPFLFVSLTQILLAVSLVHNCIRNDWATNQHVRVISERSNNNCFFQKHKTFWP